ncbi:PaaI family thioesterase [Paracnuella aquatica]|uniref:PaaI family thioesterase n=1 Tax=Paracnuella aquatica TaxID=2268757 RepID=UPI000DEF5F6B|nr:DUF4442 domain-containing protein [Paracnuella aquatica]RPD44724.1 DUF4442 domain-containing protein [Paracnuella aquatica]
MQQQAQLQPSDQFFQIIQSPWKLRLFLLRKLPAAAFSGLRIVSVNEGACTVSVPYRWSTTNPFRSTYFACLSMAAELSTGVLSMAQVWGRKPPVSMLVIGMEARFFKKATGTTFFTCSDGAAIKDAVEKAVQNGTSQTISVHSEGKNSQGEPVATFVFEWSFKAKGAAIVNSLTA